MKRFFLLEIFLISMIEDGFARRPVILPEGRLFCPKAGCFWFGFFFFLVRFFLFFYHLHNSMVDLPEGGFFCPKAGCFARRPVDSPVVFQVVLPVVFDVAIDETFFLML